ncbi:MAG TPA: 5-formyltetrahydrofolate cyclo-ligase [Candidatus Paceibacterota bacterium]|jgi:5-formyltetrahydrofolate cyclo-ligase
MENSDSRFAKKLLACRVAVGYQPLQGEPNPAFASSSVRFIISPDKSAEPIMTAKQVAVMFAETNVCLYIPGTAFDKHGTRHGRGSGWYDRFLASVPSHWMRVGLCFENSFSHNPLKRESWDQPMDWVCVQKADGMDYYETKARSL